MKIMNACLLKQKINDSGYRLDFIAKQLGITYQGFLKKLKNETEFKASEIVIMKKILQLSDLELQQIFLWLK